MNNAICEQIKVNVMYSEWWSTTAIQIGHSSSTYFYENYLCVAWLDIAEEEHHNYEEKSTEKIKATPPSTRYFYTLGQHISEWLSMLECIHMTNAMKLVANYAMEVC